mgnify:CR=1 FL=1
MLALLLYPDPAASAAIYALAFGDGGSSSLISPSHTYTRSGKFTVTQQVMASSSSLEITVMGLPAVAPGIAAHEADDQRNARQDAGAGGGYHPTHIAGAVRQEGTGLHDLPQGFT